MHTLDANGLPIPCSDRMIPVQFRSSDEGIKETFSVAGIDSKSGNNKLLLIIALILCILVAGVGGFLIYRHVQNSKKETESFGYKL